MYSVQVKRRVKEMGDNSLMARPAVFRDLCSYLSEFLQYEELNLTLEVKPNTSQPETLSLLQHSCCCCVYTQAFTAELAAKSAHSTGLHHERTKAETQQAQAHLVYLCCPGLLLLLLNVLLNTSLPLSAAETF